MNQKYTFDQIVEALKPWEAHKNTIIQNDTLSSKLFNSSSPQVCDNDDSSSSSDIQSHVLYVKYRRVDDCSFFQHWFIDIDNKLRWHPGLPSDQRIFLHVNEEEKEETTKQQSNVVSIIELCDSCLYHFMLEKFMQDKQFNLLGFNCEIITGYWGQTGIFFLSLCSLIIYFFTQYYFFLAIAIILICLFTIFTTSPINHLDLLGCHHVHFSINNVKRFVVSRAS
nr:hypothetical protein [Microctonus hyperodae filamentous virus]